MEMNFCRRCGEALTHLQAHVYKCPNEHILFANSSPSVGIFLIDSEGKVLLSIRGIEPKKSMLDAFGGFLDDEELVEDAVRRELKEELGLEPSEYSDPQFLGSGIGHYDYKNETLSVLCKSTNNSRTHPSR